MKELNPFYTPFNNTQVLIKADEKDPFTIYIGASSESIDSQQDVLFMKALEAEAESFLKKGLLSWDHLHKVKDDPKFIIGEPLDVRFDKAEKKTYVKGKLYQHVDYAVKVANLLLSKCTRLGASVGGFIKSKKSILKSISGILKVIWDELAVTYKPVNQDTMGNVSLIPIGAFVKALSVGSGVDASKFIGGRAMMPESMQGAVTLNYLQPILNELVWRVKSGDIAKSEDLKTFLSYYNIDFLYGQLASLIIKKMEVSNGRPK